VLSDPALTMRLVASKTSHATRLECMLLSYTLLQELPRVVANPSPSVYLLFLDGTNVSTFWSWMEPFVQYSFSLKRNIFAAQGSRFCAERDEIVAGNRTSFSITTAEPGVSDLASAMDVSTPEKLDFSIAAVLCARASQYPFYFPLDLRDLDFAHNKDVLLWFLHLFLTISLWEFCPHLSVGANNGLAIPNPRRPAALVLPHRPIPGQVDSAYMY
jgi:hypothetical protein